MSFSSWLQSWKSSTRTARSTAKRRPARYRPTLEALEDRLVPTTLIPLAKGDVFVSVGQGKVKEFKPDGTFVQTLDSGTESSETTGSTFDANGNFYLTSFEAGKVTKFDSNGVSLGDFGNSVTNGYVHPESILHDKAGNFYVGDADRSPQTILKLDPSGNILKKFTVSSDRRGTDWIDLAADQKTIFYDSEGNDVQRFDTSTSTQLSKFNKTSLPGSAAYALRILGDGGVLVADSSVVVRLDASGNQIKTYAPTGGASTLFALNLDPDGTSFWTADLSTGLVYRFDINTGNLLKQFSGAPFSDVAGLTVKGEITEGGGGGGSTDVTGHGKTTLLFHNPPNAVRPTNTLAVYVSFFNQGADITGDLTVHFSLTGVILKSVTGVAVSAGFPVAQHKVKAIGNEGNGDSFITISGGLRHGQSLVIDVLFTYPDFMSRDFMRKHLATEVTIG